VTRAAAIEAAAAVLVEADRLSVSLPPPEAARRAATPTGPSAPEIEARINARQLRLAS